MAHYDQYDVHYILYIGSEDDKGTQNDLDAINKMLGFNKTMYTVYTTDDLKNSVQQRFDSVRSVSGKITEYIVDESVTDLTSAMAKNEDKHAIGLYLFSMTTVPPIASHSA